MATSQDHLDLKQSSEEGEEESETSGNGQNFLLPKLKRIAEDSNMFYLIKYIVNV